MYIELITCSPIMSTCVSLNGSLHHAFLCQNYATLLIKQIHICAMQGNLYRLKYLLLLSSYAIFIASCIQQGH